MKRWIVFVLVIICLVSSRTNVAGERPSSLVVHPEQVQLSGRRDRQHVLTLAIFADSHSDVTGTATYEVSDAAIAQVNSFGLVRPLANGNCELIVRSSGLEQRIAISVRGYDDPARVDFETEVIGALGRAGCNQGACHGSPQGKNGFRLSLRGFDPELDYTTMTRESFGRRTNVAEPARSLILRKPLGEVSHQGGVRFDKREYAHQVLYDWIAEGCTASNESPELDRLVIWPQRSYLHSSNPKQQLLVQAVFDDGTVRDVTDLAVFSSSDADTAEVERDGLVTFQRTGEVSLLVRYLQRLSNIRLTYVKRDPAYRFQGPSAVNYVDDHTFKKQASLQLQPAASASDAVFLRRVYLDLIGTLPTVSEADAFLVSTDPLRRRKLVDELLERPEYGRFWALKWADVMRGNREAISERGVHNLHRFLVRQFATDRPFSEFAHEILTSKGNTIQRPAANFFRIARTPEDAAESMSQLFLGVRIQCAKCHNHPYESITQHDYFGLAAFFARVQRKGQRFGRDDEIIYVAASGEVQSPITKQPQPPIAFGHDPGEIPAEMDRRDALARWLVSGENRYFARSTVNRIWFHLIGRGIVDPIDDFRDSNPPSNPELLDALANQFVNEGFRIKPVIRSILNSATYQLSAKPVDQVGNGASPAKYFAQYQVRMLSAENILDAICRATGVPERFAGYPLGTRAMELAEGAVEHSFLKAFAKPIRDVACECARETEPSLNEVIHLINNPSILGKFTNPRSHLSGWIGEAMADERIVRNLYLATLSRYPSDRETQAALKHVLSVENKIEGFADLQHALVNSNEFLLQH